MWYVLCAKFRVRTTVCVKLSFNEIILGERERRLSTISLACVFAPGKTVRAHSAKESNSKCDAQQARRKCNLFLQSQRFFLFSNYPISLSLSLTAVEFIADALCTSVHALSLAMKWHQKDDFILLILLPSFFLFFCIQSVLRKGTLFSIYYTYIVTFNISSPLAQWGQISSCSTLQTVHQSLKWLHYKE